MIPTISTRDVEGALRRIQRIRIDKQRASKKFCLVFEGHHFPPKVVVSNAVEEAGGKPLTPQQFSGGNETNGRLTSLGFEVVSCNCGGSAELGRADAGDQGSTRRSGRRLVEPTQSSRHVQRLLHPEHLYKASEVMSHPCPVPCSPGVYAWYFDAPPPSINIEACHRIENCALLYVGISPKAPPPKGFVQSRSTLRKRIQTHYRGNAEGSTLRKTLGCLLSSRLHIELRRV
jgi:hypothetical protein